MAVTKRLKHAAPSCGICFAGTDRQTLGLEFNQHLQDNEVLNLWQRIKKADVGTKWTRLLRQRLAGTYVFTKWTQIPLIVVRNTSVTSSAQSRQISSQRSKFSLDMAGSASYC